MKSFLKEFELIFSIEKIKSDLLTYLDMEEAEVRRVISVHEIDGEEQVHMYSGKETLTILSIHLQKKYHGVVYLPFQIDVLIGRMKGAYRNTAFENYIAQLHYDKDYELINVDFIRRTSVGR